MSEQTDSFVEIITQSLSEPKKMAGDAGSYENPSVTEIIAAHRYVSGLDTVILANPLRAIRFAKLRPPGAV